ncbi:CsgG/HfaB family protein [Dyadobacter sp. LHD-138]|uniref:CsgG/HfaB family protein n=1 Tax=Dyadobacter sp. LHD-138 TaxID=3071413 RepID=UPI0027E14C93|nr:CsgG/HfaB family protein [Dyadobacter sp. LHD-138]MDQ6481919.1 CsgG/HfaB family protein [Dyadobacter sp. LHD-138]
MRKYFQYCLTLVFASLIPLQILAQKDPKISLEKVAEKCKDLPRDKRVVVKVSRFNVSTKASKANATFGDELATMLTSAIQQTNCFRVLEMNRNIGDATGEMAFAQDGFTDGSGPQAGQQLGAQLIVTGEVTDYSEGKSSTTIAVVSVGGNKATVGFTLKLLNPQTGEVLFSRDVNMTGSSSGFTGFKFAGIQTVGTTQNRAVQDAMQKAIIRAVELMAEEKDKIDIPEPLKPKVKKQYTAQNCSMLRSGSPKVIILVTEATTAGTARDNTTTDMNRREREMNLREREATVEIVKGIFGRRNDNASKTENQASRQTSASAIYKPVIIEQSATETELTRYFVEAGFRVVDPKVYGRMRKVADSTGNLGDMAALGLQMGAQMIITGQTISERTNTQGGMISCRARLEIKAIATEDGSILATNAIAGGGIDVSEAVANKIAIKNASDNMAQYLLERLCSMNVQFAGGDKGGASRAAASSVSTNVTEITVTNVNYARLTTLSNAISKNAKVKNVQKKLLPGSTEGKIQVEHTGNTDELIDALSKIPSLKFEVMGVDNGLASIAML